MISIFRLWDIVELEQIRQSIDVPRSVSKVLPQKPYHPELGRNSILGSNLNVRHFSKKHRKI